MQIDPFFQVPQHAVMTSLGEAQLPLLFKEGDYSIFLFVVSKRKVESLLQGTGLRPAVTFGNRTFVALVMGHYSITSYKPFRFASLAISVERQFGFRPTSPWKEIFSRPDHRHMGFYFLNSLLDNQDMVTMGKEIWGFPHSFGGIQLAIEESRVRSLVECAHTRKTLFGLDSAGLRFWRMSALEFTMFSVRGNHILRTLFNTRCNLDLSLPLRFRLRLGDGQHPMVENLRLLGLDNRRPLLCLNTHQFQGRIHEGSVVENLDDAPPQSSSL